MTSDTQSKSQPEQQISDPHGELSDGDIVELISFFQLLDKWDREYKMLKVVEEVRSSPSIG